MPLYVVKRRSPGKLVDGAGPGSESEPVGSIARMSPLVDWRAPQRETQNPRRILRSPPDQTRRPQFNALEIKYPLRSPRRGRDEPLEPATIIATRRDSRETVRTLTLAELIVTCDLTFLPAP